MQLTLNEKRLLLELEKRGTTTPDEIGKILDRPADSVIQYGGLLSQKGLARVDRSVTKTLTLTDEGRQYLTEGLPERQEVWSMRAPHVEELSALPSCGQLFKLRFEEGPMSDSVPAFSYLVESVCICGHRYALINFIILRCNDGCERWLEAPERLHHTVWANMKKVSRTISGVTPVAVMAKPFPCTGKCVYCPSSPEAPKSYTIESPAVLRARSCGFDARKQVEVRLKTLAGMGHPCDKVELIIMGGTFLCYPLDYQYQFVKDCYDALNGVLSGSLEEAKKLNEHAEHRCVGLCIETRPDYCGEKEIERLLDFGATRVELGVQTLDDDIHRLTKRGHGVAEVVSATRLLRDYGFKVYYHWMPGLPGSTPEHDLELSHQLFEDLRFRPDGLKLYPTLVVRGTELETWYWSDRYRPYGDEEMISLLIAIKTSVPQYVRISRLMRDIPSKFIVAGCKDLALRGSIRKRMADAGLGCQCIRCREYGHRSRDGWTIGEPSLTRMDYETFGGKEVFLSYQDGNGTLFGILRLRKNGGKAIVRELHVFGPEVPLGEKIERAAQHQGLGEKLLREAEKIARDEFKAQTLLVLSGVGAREYYRALGYSLVGAYMVKVLC